MRIVQVNVVVNKGSTGKIVFDIHQGLLDRNIESNVFFGRGEKNDNKCIVKFCAEWYSYLNKICSFFSGISYGGCYFSTRKLIKLISSYKPDVVHLHCLNGNCINIYKLIAWLKANKINTILTLHAEFMHTGNCSHAFECEKWKTGCGDCAVYGRKVRLLHWDSTSFAWKKMKRVFDGFATLKIVSVSPWLKNRAIQSPILKDCKHSVIYNGINTSVFHPYNREDTRKKLGVADGKNVLLYVTPKFDTKTDSNKGGFFVLELARVLGDNVKVFVAGACVGENRELPANIELLGAVTDQVELARLYSMADVTILTSKRETFSMVVAESMCCGTPVVGFKAGAPEMIALKKYSEFVAWGDVEKLAEGVNRMLERAIDKTSVSQEAIEVFDKKQMIKSYVEEYENMCRK